MSISNNTNPTDWNISTDIYGIVESISKVKQRYIDDEDETTLALGIFGFLTDTEAKKIQTSTIMTGRLGNEMFPLRANLTKNVLAHAIYNNIEDINAVPSHMVINIGIRTDDLDNYIFDNKFTFDAKSPIFIGDYEFHFDYDIVLVRSQVTSVKRADEPQYVYSAHYDMSIPNRLSTIVDPYLRQPFTIKIGNDKYVIIQTMVRQVTIEETIDKVISESIIENKTYTFEFENQLADFDVIVTDNGKETRLTPLPYGSMTDGIDHYCWYLFITDNTIRITFDSKSYIPGLNSDIVVKAYTTLGKGGDFNYKKIDDTSEGFFTEITSDTYNYSNINCFIVAGTDSTGGSNRKTKAELQKLIPKAALSRGSITTETDVANYFNLIDSEENRLVMQKKVDNQISRIWYGYFVLKDEDKNIIPTNTITLDLSIVNNTMNLAEDGRYVLPAGTIIQYNKDNGVGKVIDESVVPDLYSDEYFGENYYYYMTIYNIIVNPDPLYAAFYLTISNTDNFFMFDWVNENSILQFVATRCNFQRNLLMDQHIYKFSFRMAQSITDDFEMYIRETVEHIDPLDGSIYTTENITNNMKCILVLYKEETPYRWVEAKLTDFQENGYISSWEIELETDNGLDNDNNIKINNLHVARSATDINYGYFDPNTKAKLYILAKFSMEEFGRYDLDSIAPGFEGYTVTNIYEVDSGLNFYEEFTNVLDTKIVPKDESNEEFTVSGVPVAGLHYMTTEEYADFLVDAIVERKAYIDYCLKLLENSMGVDFKFFNTYGPSLTYSIGDRQETPINHVDLCLKFRVSLKSTSDIYTKDELIADIKAYIEDLFETGDWHAPNMIAELTAKYSTRVNFIEFMNYNDFWLGVQHIIKKNIEDPHIVPEFLNVRNRYDIEGNLEPCIDIEISY